LGDIAENDDNIQNLIKEDVPDVSIVGRKHSELGETLARTHHQMTVFLPPLLYALSPFSCINQAGGGGIPKND